MSGREISFGGAHMRVLLGANDGAGITIIEETVEAGTASPPHAHLRESETFYVLDGAYTFELDGVVSEATPGDLVHIPRGSTHHWTAGPDGGKSLIVFAPGGAEDYFVELAAAWEAAGDNPLPQEFFDSTRERFGFEMRWPD